MKQADVSTKASILGRLLKKGAVIYPTALDNLLAKQGDQRAAYNAAVEEALKSRARQLSLKLKDGPSSCLCRDGGGYCSLPHG